MSDYQTGDLIEFLRARLDEEQLAARIVSGPNSIGARWSLLSSDTIYDHHEQPVALGVWGPFGRGVGEHIARYDPARMEAEVDSKRHILDWCARIDPPYALGGILAGEARRILRWLALPYAGHGDYRPEWAPQ